MVENILSTSLDNIEDLGEVDLDNSLQDLKYMDLPEIEVYSSGKTSYQYP